MELVHAKPPRKYANIVPPQAMWMLLNVLALTVEREKKRRPTLEELAILIDYPRRSIHAAYYMDICDSRRRPPLPSRFAFICRKAAESVRCNDCKVFFVELGMVFTSLCVAAPRGFWNEFVEMFRAGQGKGPTSRERIYRSALDALPRSVESRAELDRVLITYHDIMRSALRSSLSYRLPCLSYVGVSEPRPPRAPSIFDPIFEVRRWLDERCGCVPGVKAREVDPVCALASRIEEYSVLGKDQYNLKARQWWDRERDPRHDRKKSILMMAQNYQRYLDGTIFKWDLDLAHF